MDMSAIKSAASDVASWAQEKSGVGAAGVVAGRAARRTRAGDELDDGARALSPAERAARFEGTLRQERVPLGRLKAMAFADGVPETREAASLRATTWKLLLGHLPLDRAQWGAHLVARALLRVAQGAHGRPAEGGGGEGGEGGRRRGGRGGGGGG